MSSFCRCGLLACALAKKAARNRGRAPERAGRKAYGCAVAESPRAPCGCTHATRRTRSPLKFKRMGRFSASWEFPEKCLRAQGRLRRTRPGLVRSFRATALAIPVSPVEPYLRREGVQRGGGGRVRRARPGFRTAFPRKAVPECAGTSGPRAATSDVLADDVHQGIRVALTALNRVTWDCGNPRSPRLRRFYAAVTRRVSYDYTG
jgi:hypothetical protein